MSLKTDDSGLTWRTAGGQTETIPFADVIKICYQDEPDTKKTSSTSKKVNYFGKTKGSPSIKKCAADLTDDTPVKTEPVNDSRDKLSSVKHSVEDSEKMVAPAVEDLKLIDSNSQTLVLSYIKHGANRRMFISEENFTMEPQESQEVLQTVKERLKNVQRPRKLMVLVNPYSGAGNASKILSSAKSIFEIAGISCDITILSETNDLPTVIQNKDLAQFNGVVVVGGDGSVSQTVTCLMQKVQKDDSIEVDDPPSNPGKQCPLPIGIIPAGTGNMMVKMLHGNDDIITATLHIIRGFHQSSNMYSIYQDGELSLYSVLMIGFGFSGELIKSSLSKKWMGSAKYLFSLLACLFSKRQPLKLKLSYRLVRDTDTSCEIDGDTDNINASRANEEEEKWVTIEDDVQGIESFLVSLMESGPTLKYSFGENSGQLFIIKKCSLGEHMKFYSHLKNNKPSVFGLNYVDCVQMSSCRIELVEPNLISNRNVYLNCDGELLTITSNVIDIRFHYCGLRIFSSPT
ncbi:ceramide kinase [Octopus bimaculoides]|uniref:DAGKc domain-containing protein n=1 Tax=Octopus bimaculoides TaxID=37653 RepID=A0A0L8I9H5_OCTBM|nr:ceramide kinase [Octopus bimaculoides]|eukprot:XP_014784081.1 PREDICTED: ceramide kinase-like [Octopus bimaculoides]